MREEFLFLNQLRYSGKTNMFGATPYLQEEFGLERTEARDILTEWMRWTQEDESNVMVGVVEEDYDDEDEWMIEDEEDGWGFVDEEDDDDADGECEICHNVCDSTTASGMCGNCFEKANA